MDTSNPAEPMSDKVNRIRITLATMRDDVNTTASKRVTGGRPAINEINNHIDTANLAVMETLEEIERRGTDDLGLELLRLRRKVSEVLGTVGEDGEEGIALEEMIDLYADKVMKIEEIGAYWAEVRGRISEGEEMKDDDILERLRIRLKEREDLQILCETLLTSVKMPSISEIGTEWWRRVEQMRKIEGTLKEAIGDEKENEGSLQDIAEKRMRKIREQTQVIQSMISERDELRLKIVESETRLKEAGKQADELLLENNRLKEKEQTYNLAMSRIEEERRTYVGKWKDGENKPVGKSIADEIQSLRGIRNCSSKWLISSEEETLRKMISKVIKEEEIERGEYEGGKSSENRGMRLPPMKLHSGRREEFDDFRMGFEIRYGKEGTRVAVAMLREVLTGKALNEYRNIPEKLKSESVKVCLDYLEKKLSEDNPFYEIELDRKLKEQRVAGRPVAIVLQELDKWVNRLHKEKEKRDEVKVRQLMTLYANSSHYMTMCQIFEEKKKGGYESMRDHLVRMEFIAKQVRENTGGRWKHDNGGVNDRSSIT
ncbi:hypothetical protein PRIPAC_91810 [Pristionchus pacificus]|uniref:Uncharacterized protein n=1 Tax=Pristionchus pacificus TaxID=54126 RepID=A0A2A6B476_PRIPA|nr:hypothetical protein PRIPAC_91810 [Pristionchus pacificus]|eukprot:PDM60680.1 hypothetical protein PRIPAC_53949 [Pristionchus pacificus]